MACYTEEMKCLSIQQPYASAIMSGVKLIEYRSWSTTFRGRFAVHASSKIDRLATLYIPDTKYLTSVILGTVDLVDVRDVSAFEGFPSFEWHLLRPAPLPKPIVYKGKLRLFDIPFDLA
jgi:hypothetical protein